MYYLQGAMQRMCSSPLQECSPSSSPRSSLARLTAPVRGNFISPHHRDTSGAGSTGSRLGNGGSDETAASVTAAVATRVEIDVQGQSGAAAALRGSQWQSLRSCSEPIKTGDKREN